MRIQVYVSDEAGARLAEVAAETKRTKTQIIDAMLRGLTARAVEEAVKGESS